MTYHCQRNKAGRVPGAVALLLSVTMLCAVPSLARAESCAAPKVWFAPRGTPAPPTSEPKRGYNCEFYQRAWQTFLYAITNPGGAPRLFGCETYTDVFVADPKGGALSGTNPLMALAPGLLRHGETTEAEEVFQAGSNAVLIDQNGHAVFYSTLMNPVFAWFVRRGRYNDIDKLKGRAGQARIARRGACVQSRLADRRQEQPAQRPYCYASIHPLADR